MCSTCAGSQSEFSRGEALTMAGCVVIALVGFLNFIRALCVGEHGCVCQVLDTYFPGIRLWQHYLQEDIWGA